MEVQTSETLSDTEKSEEMEVTNPNEKEETQDTMRKIEQEFSELKDSLFTNSIKWLEKDFERISSGLDETKQNHKFFVLFTISFKRFP